MVMVRVAPVLLVATAFSAWVPFENFVVSIVHCMPSEGEVSVLSAVESMKKAPFDIEPVPLT